MSGKEWNYQEIHRQSENNPGLLNARLQAAEQAERRKNFPEDDANKYLMDAEQLKEYYENRNRDTEENAFKFRTKYYFEDFRMADAKAARYERLANDTDAIEAYQSRHGGRKTYKRVNDVKNASSSFRKMQQTMVRQMSSNRANMTPLQKYNQREEVMKLRMDGMVAAAQLKSKPGNMHHLVTRAKYSCYMILKDQLNHLINENQSDHDRRKLTAKLKEVNTKLDNLFVDLKKYTPSVQKQWQENQFNNVQYETAKREYQTQCPINMVVSEETSKTLFHLQKFHEKYGNVQWPVRCVYKTKEGDAPINPAERKMQEWNVRVEAIREHGSDYAKQRVEEEGIKIFMNTELPSAQTLKTMGTKYLEDNLRTFYEMTHIALPYYRREIEKGKGFLFNYAEDNRDFQEKLDYVEAIRNYMDYRLSKDHGIKTDPEKGYAIHELGGGGFDERLEEMKEQILLDRDTSYGIFMKQRVNKFDLMPEIPTDAIRPPLEDEEEDEEEQEEVHEDRQEDVHEIRHPIVQPVQNEEPKAEIPTVKNLLFSSMIVREEKKEDKKEEPKIEIIEEKKEEIKEEPKNEIIEEIKEEPKDEVVVEKKEEIKEEPKNEIIEEKKEEIKEEPKNEIIEEKKEEIKEEPKNEIIEEKKDELKNVIIEKIEEDDGDGPLVEDSEMKKPTQSLPDAYDQLQTDLEKLKIVAQREKEKRDREKAKIREEQRLQKEELEKARKFYAERMKTEAAKKEEKKQNENKIIVEEPKSVTNEIKITEEPKKEIKKPKNSINEIKITEKDENKIIVEEPKNVINESKSSEESQNEIIVEKKKNTGLVIKDPKEMEELGLTEAHFGTKLSKKQKAELALAKTRYEIKAFYNQGWAYDGNEEYLQIFRKLNFELNLGRSLTAVMRTVRFGKNGKPLPKYRKNHEWNLRWLNAWANKDEKEKEKMFLDFYPHAMDEYRDEYFPEMKLSKTQMGALKNLLRIRREMNELEKKKEERKNKLIKLKKDVSDKSLREDQEYSRLHEQWRAANRKEMDAKKDAMKAAWTYAASKQFKNWLINRLSDRSEEAFERMMINRRLPSVDGLKEVLPAVATFEKHNPKRVRRDMMISQLEAIQQGCVSLCYGVKTGSGGDYDPVWTKDDALKPGELDDVRVQGLMEYMANWMEYHYEETQAPDDVPGELAELHKTNENFRKKDYPVYRKLKSFKEFTNHPVYREYDIKETRQKYHLSEKEISLDRLGRIGFRPVTFDKLNQPVTKEDEANHAWNMEWLRAWKEDDVAKREAMIGEQLSKIFNGIHLPVIKLTQDERDLLRRCKEANDAYDKAVDADNKCKEKAKDSPKKRQLEKTREEANQKWKVLQKEAHEIGKKYSSTYAKWLEGLGDGQEMALLNLGQISGCIDLLQKMHPSIAYFFKKNPALATLMKLADGVSPDYGAYAMSKKYRLKMSTQVEVRYEEDYQGDLKTYETDMADGATECLKSMVLYDVQKDEKTVPFVPLSDNEISITDPEEQEEFAKRYRESPNLTPKSYRVLKVLESSLSILVHNEYNEEYEKGKNVLNGARSFSRDATLVMRRVDFDQKGKPKTGKDVENHKWNMQWLQAIRENNVKQREKMLSEEIPKRFWIKDLPQPSEELLSLHRKIKDNHPRGWAKSPEGQETEKSYQKELAQFKKELERYTEEKLEKKDVDFFYEIQTGQSLDTVRKTHPSLQKYLDDNPEIYQRSRMIDQYMNIAGGYFTGKYYIDNLFRIDDNTEQKHLESKSGHGRAIEDASIDGYLDACLKYQEVKKIPAVPYQKVIQEEDKEKKDEKAETVRQKKEEKKESKKSKPVIDAQIISQIEKTNLRANTFKIKEYIDLAKEIDVIGTNSDLNGAISLGLETVEVDREGKVLPEYEKAHQRNLKWLNMLKSYSETDDQRVRNEIQEYIIKTMTELVKEFPLPDKNDLYGVGSYKLVSKDPVKMKTMIQRLHAYETFRRANPEMASIPLKQKALMKNVNLLLDAFPLLLDNIKAENGIDLWGDEYKVTAKTGRSKEEEIEFNQKREAYLQARDTFLKGEKK